MPQRIASKCRAQARAIPAVAGVVLLLLAAAPAGAQVQNFPPPEGAQVQIFPTPVDWTVAPDFNNEHFARANISGAVCTSIGARGCLAVNDASNFAQAFAIGGHRIATGTVVELQSNQVGGLTFSSVDAEAAAFDADFFYIVGSHGKSTPASEDANFLAFRFKLDTSRVPAPPGPFRPQVERSGRLREAISTAVQQGLFGVFNPPAVPKFEIEGVAVKEGRMFIGFRAPSIAGRAFIMSVDAQALFGSGNLNVAVRKLALGPGVGIRDLALISTGILVLTGPVADQPAAPSLVHFDIESGAVQLLGNVTEPTNLKAETLIVLQEDPEFIRFLLLFDGVANGRPIEYFVSR